MPLQLQTQNKDTFRHASFIGDNPVVFPVKGNNYRVVCGMDYPR
ncbi:MAG: hypothetical protein D3916_04720 [Candidatus Electrothrix sp. MAN1_4]|nr:hypothetical protein [Candidatus Electrothrix sp. MAN1_4]